MTAKEIEDLAKAGGAEAKQKVINEFKFSPRELLIWELGFNAGRTVMLDIMLLDIDRK